MMKPKPAFQISESLITTNQLHETLRSIMTWYNTDGGKPAVIQRLKNAHGYKTVVMFGDGATDMQARPPADAFVGFGGIVIRENVKKGSDWFVTDFEEVIDVLQNKQ